MENNKLRVGSDFSGVGAFDQALTRLGQNYETVFACDMDKYARQTFIHNYGDPEYYPENVYDREIPKESLDIYMTSPPCQSFSLAGKRKGEDDDRGILFYNSHEFIKINKPRYFIFENVKGLLSDDNGNTFAKWIQYLGGKSVNGVTTLFPHEESLPYHIYWKVLNAKNYNIPQNRERVFIIGIRDDEDNNFTWPKEMFLERRLRDVLESDVDEKYYLSERIIDGFIRHTENQNTKGNGFKFDPKDGESIGNCITARCFKMGVDDNYIKVKSATKQGYELAEIGEDIINFEHPDSKTRRGRVGVGVGQTLTTSCNQGVEEVIQLNPSKESGGKQPYQQNRVYADYGIMTTVDTGCGRPSVYTNYKIRKLTPRECFRLMDFPDTFSWTVSDSQAYKQAGNSICVGVLSEILRKLILK